MSLICLCVFFVFCDSFISLLLLSDSLSCVLNSVYNIYIFCYIATLVNIIF